MRPGALCVMIFGALMMPTWSANSWVSRQQVQLHVVGLTHVTLSLVCLGAPNLYRFDYVPTVASCILCSSKQFPSLEPSSCS